MNNLVNIEMAANTIAESNNLKWRKMKLSKLGTKKSFIIYLLNDGKCFECNVELQFNNFHASHIIPQQTYIAQGLPINNLLTNLVCLCPKCNLKMKTANGFEYWSKAKVNWLKKRNTQIDKAENNNDVRSILKMNIKSFDGKVLTSLVMEKACDQYAIENPYGKFARIHKNGQYRKVKAS